MEGEPSYGSSGDDSLGWKIRGKPRRALNAEFVCNSGDKKEPFAAQQIGNVFTAR
jgi:hypothetical protein